MTYFFQQLVNGLSIGSQYALWCVGYGMVYQVLGLMHFAHGNTLVFAAYFALTVLTMGAPFWMAVLAGMAMAAIVAIVIERYIYRPLLIRKQLFMAFVAAMAAGFVLQNAVRYFWGVNPVNYPEGLLPTGSLNLGGVQITYVAVMNFAAAALVLLGFQAFLNRSRHGQAIVAVSQDRDTAELMGISVSRIVALVYGLSAVIGMVGVFLYAGNFRTLTISVGFTITLKAFIVPMTAMSERKMELVQSLGQPENLNLNL